MLIGVLGSIFMMSRESEKAEAHRLEKLAGSEQKGIEDYEAVKEHASQLEKEDGAADDSSRSIVAIHWSMESCSSERRFCRLKDMGCLSIFTCRTM